MSLLDFARMTESARTDLLVLSTTTHPTKSLPPQISTQPVCASRFACSGSKCDFYQALKDIQKNDALKELYLTDVLKTVVKDFRANAISLQTHRSDGIQVVEEGEVILDLRREEGSVTGRTSIIDLDKLRSLTLRHTQACTLL
jgi:hypothetical protein